MKVDFGKGTFHFTENPLKDVTLWAVIAGNLLSIYFAYAQGWDIAEIMWIFWAQSLIIGAANVLRILSLKQFSTDGFTMNGAPVPENAVGKIIVSGFFTFHYGFFHFVYSFFLWDQKPLTAIDPHNMFLIMLCVLGFLGSHFFSLWRNFGDDFKDARPNLGTLMFYPYIRIIPMHFTILFGQMIDGTGMFLFLFLKMVADAGMHMVEHALFRKSGAVEIPGTLQD